MTVFAPLIPLLVLVLIALAIWIGTAAGPLLPKKKETVAKTSDQKEEKKPKAPEKKKSNPWKLWGSIFLAIIVGTILYQLVLWLDRTAGTHTFGGKEVQAHEASPPPKRTSFSVTDAAWTTLPEQYGKSVNWETEQDASIIRRIPESRLKKIPARQDVIPAGGHDAYGIHADQTALSFKVPSGKPPVVIWVSWE